RLQVFLKLRESPCTVADGVLLLRKHLAKGATFSFGHKDWVVAKAHVTSRRPKEVTTHPPFKHLEVAFRRSKSKGTDKLGAAIGVVTHLLLDTLHGQRKVLARTGPASRMNARCSPQGRHAQAAIVGQRRQCRAAGRRPGLDRRI